ncbi:hypothetical protein I7I51_01095 [Histoplasma capsulatum]|uniref:Uncharacterized protein n=1 Tax=Ajellomyces capsulatus TaxID=5037 RepID=A0A8A1MHF1_AJECA|nr:hypothetical protein I7I51_01095 [Histoplasma capsulatum]
MVESVLLRRDKHDPAQARSCESGLVWQTFVMAGGSTVWNRSSKISIRTLLLDFRLAVSVVKICKSIALPIFEFIAPQTQRSLSPLGLLESAAGAFYRSAVVFNSRSLVVFLPRICR